MTSDRGNTDATETEPDYRFTLANERCLAVSEPASRAAIAVTRSSIRPSSRTALSSVAALAVVFACYSHRPQHQTSCACWPSPARSP